MSHTTTIDMLRKRVFLMGPELLKQEDGTIISTAYRVDPEYVLSIKTADGFVPVELVEEVPCEGCVFIYGAGAGDNIIWEIADQFSEIEVSILPKY